MLQFQTVIFLSIRLEKSFGSTENEKVFYKKTAEG